MLPASLSELDLLVLALIHEDPCHGYALVNRLRAQCSQSAVYRCLKRLRDQQLISGTVIVQGKMPSRHHFTLSGAGQQVVGQQSSWGDQLQERLGRSGRQYQKLNLLLSFRPSS